MKYIEKTLSKGETLICHFEQHWFVFVIPSLLLFFFGLPFFFTLILGFFNPEIHLGLSLFYSIPTLISLYFFFLVKYREMSLTSYKVFFKRGLIGIRTDELILKKIETVEIRQSIIGRVFSFGHIYITGTGTSDLYLKNLENPSDVKKKIDNQIHNFTD